MPEPSLENLKSNEMSFEEAKEQVLKIKAGDILVFEGGKKIVVDHIVREFKTYDQGPEPALDVYYPAENGGPGSSQIDYRTLWTKLSRGQLKIEQPVKDTTLDDATLNNIDSLLDNMKAGEDPAANTADPNEDIFASTEEDDAANAEPTVTTDNETAPTIESEPHMESLNELEGHMEGYLDSFQKARKLREAGVVMKRDIEKEAREAIERFQTIYNALADTYKVPADKRVDILSKLPKTSEKEPVTPAPAPKPAEAAGTETTPKKESTESKGTFETVSDAVLRQAVEKSLSALAPNLQTYTFTAGPSSKEYTMTLDLKDKKEGEGDDRFTKIIAAYRITPDNKIVWIEDSSKNHAEVTSGGKTTSMSALSENVGKMFQNYFLNELEKASGKKVTELKINTESDVLQVSFEK